MKNLHRNLNEPFEHVRFTSMNTEEKVDYIKTYVIEFEGHHYEYDEEKDQINKSAIK